MRRRQQLELARKSYWINKPAWTITELVFLINGYEPKLLDENIGIDETGVRAKLPDWLDLNRYRYSRHLPAVL